MDKTTLVYGTYNHKEWNRILDVFEEAGVEYKEDMHVHTHGTNTRERDTWYFYFLESEVTPEEEKLIREKMNLLKKRYS